MNKKTKRFLVTTLSVATLTCGAIGWVTNPEKQKIASAETSTTAISLVDGAACRIRTESDAEQGSGIRFKASLDKAQWTALAESNEMIAGIMILPTDYITETGGYTHSALDTAGKKYLDFTYTEDEVGEKTVLAASMVDILDQNYTRDFSGVAYLKSATAFAGATEYDGAYYAYAEYTEENNSRSIYEIATGAYNDRKDTKVTTDYEYSVTYNAKTSYSPYTDDQREVLKGYLDGVVDIKKNAYAEVFVANNTEYYTSPYTIEKKSNAEFVVNYDLSVTAKGMLYKGKRVKSLSVKEGKTSITLTDRVVLSADADINADGSVTLGGRVTPGGYAYQIAQIDNSYVGIEGEYGVGTYIDITFKGNNMPEVLFFADEINGNMTSMGGKGLLFSNGIANATNNVDLLRKYHVFGPNRLTLLGGLTDGDKVTTNNNYEGSVSTQFTLVGYTSGTLAESDYPYLTQYGLAKTPDTEYKYTVGTYENGGTVYAHIALYDVTNGKELYNFDKATKLSASDLTAGSIVLYGTVAGTANTTTFKYSAPYTAGELKGPSSGATANYDGSVTLAGKVTPGGYAYHIAQIDNSYVGIEGEYGVGTYIDITFKGNNMPEVLFFADEINGNMTSMGGKGLLFSNGIANAANNVDLLRKYYVFGPNRLTLHGGITDADKVVSSTNNYEGSDSRLLTLVGYTSGGATESNYPYLTQYGLAQTPDTEYKYTVGTYENGNKVYLHIELYDLTNDQTVYTIDQATSLNASDITAGSIVLYGTVAGTANTTTFTYSEPYTLGGEIEEEPEEELPASSDATFNADGSVTLGGRATPGAYSYQIAQLANSYLAIEGEYSLGTYIDITFKGNNMPEVLFFADEINGNMTSMGGKGLLFSNGIANAANNVDLLRKYYVFGPNRLTLHGGITDADKVVSSTNNYEGSDSKLLTLVGYASGTLAEGAYPYLTQYGLAQTPDTEYKYTVGTYEKSGVVYVYIELYDLTNGKVLYTIDQATSLSASDITAGSIVLYGTVAGTANTTTFKYSEPYEKHGESVNADGSVTLTGKEAHSAGWKSGVSEMLNNSYIVYDDEYILGTEVAFTFKGNNLPQVMLFADEINGDMSKLGGRGILLMNGLYVTNKPSGATSNYLGENKLVCFGPNRLYDNYYSLVVQKQDCDVSFESGYEWVTLDGNTSYKYVVWTEETDGKIVVCVELYNAVTSALLSKGSYATGVGINDIAAGAIVVYAAVKGAGNDTTFFCHEPKMHEDTMSFYTYGTPGTYTTATDLKTEAVLEDYVASGMNTMVLAGGNGFTGETAWASSKTKSVMDTARNLGVKKFIINDDRFNAGLCIEGSLIGDGCKFASETALDTYVLHCINDYVNEKNFYGVILKDEPGYTYATSMGQLYRSIKRVAKMLNTEIYVQINLHPMSDEAKSYYKAELTSSLYNDYVDYIDLFLAETGADMICVDKYPFMNSGFINYYYSCYKALAEACAKHGAEFGFVLQSWTSSTAKTVSQEEMNLQMNAALAFGAKEIAFYTYVPSDGGENNSSSFVDIDGNKTEIYTYAQNAINDAKEVEKLLADYEYVGAAISDKSKDGEFVDDTFAKLTYTATAWTVVTESYNAMTSSYLYTAVGAVASTVTMTFTSYTQAYVVKNGAGSTVDLQNGVYTATLALGEVVYIIPLT